MTTARPRPVPSLPAERRSRSLALLGLALALAVAATACAPATLYRWNGYDDRLYAHYRNPQDREAWVEGLKVSILDAEGAGRRVPPGIYAEYGYALQEEGRVAEAITYYGRERDTWPESRLFMEKMIRNAQRRQAPGAPAPVGPAGAVEGKP